MSAITSNEIQHLTTAHCKLELEQPQQVAFNDRPIGVSETAIVLSGEHREAVERLATLAMRGFGIAEPTLVARTHGIPTLLARIDCTITPEGIGLFECDERPAGIGITDAVLKQAGHQGILHRLTGHFREHLGVTPIIARHPNAKPNDDGLVFNVKEPSDAMQSQAVLVRGEPGDMRTHPDLAALQARSVSTVLSKGDKRYLLDIPEACACLVDVGSVDSLQVNQSFVLKPVQGSKAQGVDIYLAPGDRTAHGKHGIVTFERARRTIAAAAAGTLLLQKFIPPIPTVLPGGAKGNTILRIFTLVHPGGRCEAIGGTYVTRPELIVHGASNAICGAVLV